VFKRITLVAALSLSMNPLLSQAATVGNGAEGDWIARSNEDAKILLDVTARFSPEDASDFGAAQYDKDVADLRPHLDERMSAALAEARQKLSKRLAQEKDPNVHQDLAILIEQIDLQREGIALERKYLLPFEDVGLLVFNGEFVLLKDEAGEGRAAAALDRLKCYVGMASGCTPITELAKALTVERLDDKTLLAPYKPAVEQQLAKARKYLDGLRKLFAKRHIDGANEPLGTLEKQLADYDAWVRDTIVPRAREDFRIPEPLYAHRLKQFGLDVDPNELIKQAMLEFSETRSAMEVLAPVVAAHENIPATDYLSVLKALKSRQLDKASVLPTYNRVIASIEDAIAKYRVIDLPKRSMAIRIASDAENAAVASPHMDPPAFIGNKGEKGTFVLTTGHPGTDGGSSETYDDFTYDAAAWTLTAHEGRPGHELQYAGMIEHGVSITRGLFAFNSVNAEGWALYSEMEMLPYEPPAGQFVALQFRLLRAARAFLDPMLNLGLISPQRAHDVLVHEAGFSEALAKQEIDRYTFQSPGQAASYFYGYARLMQLRVMAELALGDKFDRKDFNDFVVSQGMLPPALMAEAVRTQFIPAEMKK